MFKENKFRSGLLIMLNMLSVVYENNKKLVISNFKFKVKMF